MADTCGEEHRHFKPTDDFRAGFRAAFGSNVGKGPSGRVVATPEGLIPAEEYYAKKNAESRKVNIGIRVRDDSTKVEVVHINKPGNEDRSRVEGGYRSI